MIDKAPVPEPVAFPGDGLGGFHDQDQPLLRARLDLGYDGTSFAGWARQPDQRTVQGALEDALAVVVRDSAPPSVTVAGRTDAGVHARGQVAHADVAVLPSLRWLNYVLPQDVRVRSVAEAPPGFDARFSALSRRYLYRIADGPPDPLRRHDTLGWPRRLDLDAMNNAGRRLSGEHDFAAYCKRREGATTIRRLIELSLERGAGGVIEATIEADAFCHSMVRALIGSLIAVGEGRRDAQWPERVLAAGVRDSGVLVVPAHGLCLEEVTYPPAGEMRARATVTRRVRTLTDSLTEGGDVSIR